MKKKLFLFCIIILFLISVIFLYSEVVVLKNGDVIRGKLIKMDEDTMTVLAKYGEIVIDRDDIESIYSDEEAYKEKQTTTKSNIVEKGKKNNIEMIFVNGGTFIMGDTFSDGKKDETPVHNVAVNDYYIGKYEVTVEEFDEYCDEFRYKENLIVGHLLIQDLE